MHTIFLEIVAPEPRGMSVPGQPKTDARAMGHGRARQAGAGDFYWRRAAWISEPCAGRRYLRYANFANVP